MRCRTLRKDGSTRWYFEYLSVTLCEPWGMVGVSTSSLKSGGSISLHSRHYPAMVTSPTPHMHSGLPRSARVLPDWLVLRDWTVLRSATANGSRCCRHEIETLAANRPCWAPPGYPPTFQGLPSSSASLELVSPSLRHSGTIVQLQPLYRRYGCQIAATSTWDTASRRASSPSRSRW